MDPKCETCRFWEGLSGEYGLCRRHAPRPATAVDADGQGVSADDVFPVWPRTMGAEWCGEHQPKFARS